jgi:prophage regulatory protein
MKPAKQQLKNPKDNLSLPQLDPNRLIRLKEVLRIVPVSASTWWNWVATSRAPAPIRLGNRCTCWRYIDVISLADHGKV